MHHLHQFANRILLPLCLIGAWVCASAAAPLNIVAYPLTPYVMEEKGAPSGLAVTLFTQMTKEAGLDVKIQLLPTARAFEMLDEGNTFIVALARTPEREPKYKWVAQVYADSFEFITLAPNPAINSFDEAKAAGTILVMGNAAPHNVLRNKGFTNLDSGGLNEDTNFNKLLLGRGKAWFAGSSVARYLARTNKAEAKIVFGKPVLPANFWIAASLNAPPDMIQKLQGAFQKLQANGEYGKIFAILK
jgi:polar amino acid transport system substrate-binding protein